MNTTQSPVVIIGAGPTGLTAALNLCQQGIECMIIDKRNGPVKTSNALGIQARTLESLQNLGIIDQLLAQGHHVDGLKIHNQKEEIVFISLQDLETKYPFVLGLPQSQTEQILLDKLATHGVEVQRDVELINFVQQSDKIELTCKNAQQESMHITTKWLLGCDGAHSRVREVLQIPFLGKDLPQHFIMADIPKNDKFQLNYHQAHAFWGEQGVMVVIPLKSFYRIIIDVSHNKALENMKNPPIELFQQLSEKICPYALGLDNAIWSSGFWIHEHVVSQYQKGNVFLLGDAAHEHSPVGGQGMNTGMQDAMNITWKLAMLEKNHLQREVLASYQEERLPIAKHVVEKTTLATKIVTLRSSWVRKIRLYLFKILTHNSHLKESIAQTISELTINYMKTKHVGESGLWFKGIKPGSRVISQFLPYVAADKFTLMIAVNDSDNNAINHFVDEIVKAYPEVFQIYIISPVVINNPVVQLIADPQGALRGQLGIRKSGFYLIRPDEYVAYRSTSLGMTALQKCCERVGIK